MTFAIEKMKLASFSLFLDAFPPRPKMPFEQLNVAIQIYNMCKGRLGSRGERGCISERRLSGRVLDSRPKGRGFEPHRRHCVVSLSKTHIS